MTTLSEIEWNTNQITAPKEINIPVVGTTTQSSDDIFDARDSFDIEDVAEWVSMEQNRLREQHIKRANPVRVESDTIRIDESAMLYDTVYPVELSDGTTYHVIFTSDGAIEIYEVAP